MKRTMCIVVSILILCSGVAFALTTTKNITVSPNTATINVDGSKVIVDNFNLNGTLYIPLRAVSESMGAVVGWDQLTKTASIISRSTPNAGVDYKSALYQAADYYALQMGFELLQENSDTVRDVYLIKSLQTAANISVTSDAYVSLKKSIDAYLSSIVSVTNPDINRLKIRMISDYTSSLYNWNSYISTGNVDNAYKMESETTSNIHTDFLESVKLLTQTLTNAKK